MSVSQLTLGITSISSLLKIGEILTINPRRHKGGGSI